MTDEQGDATSGKPGATRERNNEPLILALIGLGVAVLLLAASALPVILSRGDDDAAASDDTIGFGTVETAAAVGTLESGSTDPTAPTTGGDVASDEQGTTAPDDTASGTATSDGTTAGTTTAGTTTAGTTTPDGSTPTTGSTGTATGGSSTGDAETDGADDVPESIAVVLGGKIYLEGAVPDEASRDEIVALATEIFTADNVIDNYFIDPRASDPNLGNIRVDDTVLFATDSARISPEFEPLLNQGFALLTIRPSAEFVIEGHTDSRGSDEYNLELSQERADAIVRWYTDRGIHPSRLTAIGRGETQLIASDDTAEGRERNRRIEVTIENLLVDP